MVFTEMLQSAQATQPEPTALRGDSGVVERPRRPSVLQAASTFEPATADELDALAFTRRFDRKFLLRADRAYEVLRSLPSDYHVVLAGSETLGLYDTMYFDTPSLRLYHDHRRRRAPRFKIRVRNYVDRSLSMLEYKEKTARGDTRKLRWKRASKELSLQGEDVSRLREAVPHVFADGDLQPAARTVFHRLMLLNSVSRERSTLDFNLSFSREAERRDVDQIAVVEVKDAGRGVTSPLVWSLRRAGARKHAFSKYCVAVALLTHERSNTFLPSLRALDGAL